MKQLILKNKILWLLAITLYFVGCEEDDATLPTVTAGFAYELDESTGVAEFNNLSSNADTYSWDFGDETNSTEVNPVKVFETGTYTVVLTASNAAGASDTFEDTLTVAIPEPLVLPITFDNTAVDYSATAFGGASFEIIDNPDVSGTNAVDSKVGAVTNSGAADEGFFFSLGTPIDLTTNKTITMNFLAETAVDVLLKLEEGTNFVEVTANHGGTGWEALSFTFTSSDSFSVLTLFVDGPGTTPGTFYMDDIVQEGASAGTCDAETAQSLDAADFNLTFETDPGTAIGSFDAVYSFADNPDSDNSVNSSCKVGKIERNGGAQFANNQIELSSKLDFNSSSGFKLKVYSGAVGYDVLVKLEDKTDDAINTEVSQTTTVAANQWEELEFTFASSESGKYDKIILFFALGTNTTETYYIDDFALFGSGGGGMVCTDTLLELPIDFDCASIDYATKIVGDVSFTVIDNPELSGINNTASKVGQITNVGANWENSFFNLDSPIDFTTDKRIKLKLYSTQALPIKLKLEDPTAGPDVEVDVNHTGSGWEELNFDFTSSEAYNDMVIFVDGPGTAAGVFYVDDIEQVAAGGGGGSCPAPPTGQLISNGDLETGTDDCWIIFDNSGTVNITNADNNGGTYSAYLLAEPMGGGASAPVLKQEEFAKNTLSPGDVVTVSFDIKADLTPPGAVVKVALFSEQTSGAVRHDITLPTFDGSWQTVTMDVTTAATLDSTRGLSLEFQADCGGNAGCKIEMYIDNVSVVIK